jgi:hypothetical protein
MEREMDPVLVAGERKDQNRTEAEARADRAKREADHAARENLQLEQKQFNRLFGGIK